MEVTDSIFCNIVEASPYPVYVCLDKEMVVSVANEATLKAWGKDASVIGKRFLEALPEMKGSLLSNYSKMFYRTGETYCAKNDHVKFVVDGRRQTYYFNFSYQAIRKENTCAPYPALA